MTTRSDNAGGDLELSLADSPDIYAQKLDLVRSCVLLIRFAETDYRAASFLDDRILTPATKGSWMPLDRVAAALRGPATARPVHYVLHTGHVGSTLVSRLLDETGRVLSLREPLPLRTLAEAHDALGLHESLLSAAQFDLLVDVMLKLWGRGYASTQCTVVKATSSSARVAPALLRRSASSRAIYLNLRAEPYLATLLAGPNSWQDLRGHGTERMRRLHSKIAAPTSPLHALSRGELAAMSWLVESLTQQEVLDQFASRVIAVDFDALLADVPGTMGRILGHFGLPNDLDRLAQLAASPVLARYSKAPEHAFTPAVRAELLDAARREHRDEIGRGLRWIEALARVDPSVARVSGAS